MVYSSSFYALKSTVQFHKNTVKQQVDLSGGFGYISSNIKNPPVNVVPIVKCVCHGKFYSKLNLRMPIIYATL